MLRAGDFCQLAAELAAEHGALALDYARRAALQFECEGRRDRARFWFAIAILLDDIARRRLDPNVPVSLH